MLDSAVSKTALSHQSQNDVHASLFPQKPLRWHPQGLTRCVESVGDHGAAAAVTVSQQSSASLASCSLCLRHPAAAGFVPVMVILPLTNS